MKGVIMKYFVTMFFALIICVGNLFAQWNVWDGSTLPMDSINTSWYWGEWDPDAPAAPLYSTIIDDPDITGNKILKFEEPNGSGKETFRVDWEADPTTGATLVFRAKALNAGSFNRDIDLYVHNGQYRERLVSNNGTELKLNKSGVSTAYDISDWHIFRLTIVEDQIELFIDEEELSWLVAGGEAHTDNLFLFGDNGSATIGMLWDWMIWDVSGAYPPGQGDPLPAELTGLPAAIKQISSNLPGQFELNQNYPNPFNPSTEITFKVQKISNIEINVYNLNGQLIRNLVNEEKNIGTYSVNWNGLDSNGKAMPSGVYFYAMKADGYNISKKMTLIR